MKREVASGLSQGSDPASLGHADTLGATRVVVVTNTSGENLRAVPTYTGDVLGRVTVGPERGLGRTTATHQGSSILGNRTVVVKAASSASPISGDFRPARDIGVPKDTNQEVRDQ